MTSGNGTYINEAAGIAEGNFPVLAKSYSGEMSEADRTRPVLAAYDGVFRTSYRFPPYNPNRLIGAKGYDYMEDMLTMGACWASFNLKRYAVLQNGFKVVPATSDPMSSDHEEASFYAEALQYALDNIRDEEVDMPQDFASVLFDQMQAAWLGFRLAEIEFRTLNDTNIPGLDGKYGFTGFWSKTNKQVGFDIDPRTMNPKRFVSYTPGEGFDGNIHPEKVWYYAHAKSANLPTGQGDASRVYKNYFALDVLQKLWAIALERWGAPVFVAQYPAGAETELQAALDSINEIRQGQAPVLPDNIKYELVTAPQGVFEAFEASADWHVRQIALTINANTLSTGEGKHGATSAGSDQHADSGDTVYDYLADRIAGSFNSQVIRRWMRYNWGVKSLRLAPSIKLRHTEGSPQDMLALAQMLNLLVQMQNMPGTSKVIRETIGLPPIDADEDRMLQEQKQAAEEAQQQMADAKQSGVGGGGNGGSANMSVFSDHDHEVWLRRLTTAIMARNELSRRAA